MDEKSRKIGSERAASTTALQSIKGSSRPRKAASTAVGERRSLLLQLHADFSRVRFQAIDQIESPPAVSNGVVYVGSGLGLLYALDATGGKEKWKFQAMGEVQCSPAVSSGVVYFTSDDGYLRALDAKRSNDHYLHAVDTQSGQEKWKFQTGDAVYSYPAISDGVVYFESLDGYLRSTNASSVPAAASSSPKR